MTWFKLDDQMPNHPKIAMAGGDAAWLWVCGGCYVAAYGTDGMIPKAQVPKLSDRRSTARLAARLVDVGLWVDRGDRYEMHDYLAFNPSADEVADRRLKRAEAGRKGGKRSGKVRGSKAEAKNEANASANGKQPAKQKRSEIEPRPPTPLEVPTGTSTPVASASKRRGYTKAERDPLFSALIAVFGPASTETRRTFYGSTVSELLDADATAAEVERRGRILLAKDWHDCTPAALVKHWDTLGKRSTRPDPSEDTDAMSRRRA